ncbi:hypothetical protein AABD41_01555 [Staphylococcus pseudoxylosus]|uniref:hypothetical protein n=1 Tax=Staphylococcus pseudoxylosus TaxID=2282419 RepID=UPI00398AD7FF
MFDKDKFKTSLTNYDIGQAISHFNGESFEGKNGELISTTVCHHKSGGSHKLYYYSDTQMFHCYTGCGSFDIYSLIEKRMTMEGLNPNFGDTIKRLGTILGININFNSKIIGVQKSIKTINDWDWLNKVKRKEKIEPQLQTHNKSILSYFEKIYPKPWYEEGISIETMEKYDIRFYSDMFQTIIPHHDETGNLIGIRSRNWDKYLMKRAKYIPTYINDKGYNHPLGYALYGLYQNKRTIKHKKKAMIVEGEKSCLISDTYYGHDNFVVAVCGSSMSKYQADLLLNLGIEEVIIAIDKEYIQIDTQEYKEYMNKVRKIGKHFAPFISTYHLTDTRGVLGIKESPLDVTKEELENIMRNDKHKLTIKDLKGED